MQQEHFPFAVFGRVEGGDNFCFVDEDSESGMAQMVEHLLELGHRRFGVITPPSNLMFTQFRLRGIRRKLAEAGLDLDDSMVYAGDLTQRGGYLLAKNMLDREEPPTAIIACNDLMAIGAMSAIQESGLDVGKDISVTGFDDIPMSEHSHPPLTTLQQPIYQIGVLLCEMLVQTIRGDELENPNVILQPKLMIRQSSGFAPG